MICSVDDGKIILRITEAEVEAAVRLYLQEFYPEFTNVTRVQAAPAVAVKEQA